MTDFIKYIILSLTWGIIVVVIVYALTHTKLREVPKKGILRKKRIQWIIAAAANVVQIFGIIIFVYEVILPGPKIKWKLTGTVIDGVLSTPVDGVEVTVLDFSHRTNENGRYSIEYDGAAKDKWTLRFARAGYKTFEQTVGSDKDTIIVLK